MTSLAISPSIDQGALENFRDSFHELAQQSKSRLVNSNVFVFLPSKGKTNHYARIGRLELVGEVRGHDHEFLGHTAPDHAGPADAVFLRDRHLLAAQRRQPRRPDAPGSGTDDEEVVVVGHSVSRSSRRKQGSSPLGAPTVVGFAVDDPAHRALRKHWVPAFAGMSGLSVREVGCPPRHRHR